MRCDGIFRICWALFCGGWGGGGLGIPDVIIEDFWNVDLGGGDAIDLIGPVDVFPVIF